MFILNFVGFYPNNWGYNMQEKGRYTPYFIVVDVKIPLTEEQKEKLRKSKQRY